MNTGKLTPPGRHVPTDAEWTVLADFSGDGDAAGEKLKETGSVHWQSPDT